jgi:hypothetical protein
MDSNQRATKREHRLRGILLGVKSHSEERMETRGQEMLPSLLNITIEQVAKGLDDGTFTVTDLVRGCIRRIEEVNHILNTVIDVNPNVESIAKSLDEELKQHGRRGKVIVKSWECSPC